MSPDELRFTCFRGKYDKLGMCLVGAEILLAKNISSQDCSSLDEMILQPGGSQSKLIRFSEVDIEKLEPAPSQNNWDSCCYGLLVQFISQALLA